MNNNDTTETDECGECGQEFEASTENNAQLLKEFHYVREHTGA